MVGLHIYRLAVDGTLVLEGANAAADAILGVERRKLLKKAAEDVFSGGQVTGLLERIRRVADDGGEFSQANVIFPLARGESVFLTLSVFHVEPDRAVVAFYDTAAYQRGEAEREKLLAQLVQAQKLDSIGQLAGGVIHDFNNLLHGIMVQMELCRDELESGHPVQAHLSEISSEAQRSARLVRQLLSYVSRQEIAPQRLDINEAVSGMRKLLRRLLGKKIELIWRPDPAAGAVLMDASQFDQILINLAVNARDAMQGSGTLTIETHRILSDKPGVRALAEGASAGGYVRLILRDTGCGMDAATQARMFESFFTTKLNGHGAGLGLATVHRIIQENQGEITVQSESGKGTAFEIDLPRVEISEVHAVSGPREGAQPAGGNERILLVDDEKIIRLTTCRVLQKLGYQVLVSESPEEALQMVAGLKAPIDLLLTDVMLPGMTGRELAVKLTRVFPTLKCLFMSGCAEDEVTESSMLPMSDINFIAKPFSRDAFALKLREVLDASAAK